MISCRSAGGAEVTVIAEGFYDSNGAFGGGYAESAPVAKVPSVGKRRGKTKGSAGSFGNSLKTRGYLRYRYN